MNQANDRPMRCRGCMYVLDGLPAGPCPDCGLRFDPELWDTYTRRPPYVWWRFWLPGFLLATIGGAASIAALLAMGSPGWGLVFAAPVCAGALLGYGTRSAKTLTFIALFLTGATMFILTAFSMSFAGAFCGLVLGGIVFGPGLMGLFAGFILRLHLRQTRFTMRDYLSIIVLLLLPTVIGAIEPHGFPPGGEVIVTERSLTVSSDRAWQALQFFEEVKRPPPPLLRFVLPRPLRVEGRCDAPGDITICHYEGGSLTKRILDSVPPTRLSFEVIDQHLEFDGAVQLRGGVFEFTDVAGGRASATLTTEYQTRLRPRWVWRWAEELAVRSLHDHVLRAIEDDASTEPAAPLAAESNR